MKEFISCPICHSNNIVNNKCLNCNFDFNILNYQDYYYEFLEQQLDTFSSSSYSNLKIEQNRYLVNCLKLLDKKFYNQLSSKKLRELLKFYFLEFNKIPKLPNEILKNFEDLFEIHKELNNTEVKSKQDEKKENKTQISKDLLNELKNLEKQETLINKSKKRVDNNLQEASKPKKIVDNLSQRESAVKTNQQNSNHEKKEPFKINILPKNKREDSPIYEEIKFNSNSKIEEEDLGFDLNALGDFTIIEKAHNEVKNIPKSERPKIKIKLKDLPTYLEKIEKDSYFDTILPEDYDTVKKKETIKINKTNLPYFLTIGGLVAVSVVCFVIPFIN